MDICCFGELWIDYREPCHVTELEGMLLGLLVGKMLQHKVFTLFMYEYSCALVLVVVPM